MDNVNEGLDIQVTANGNSPSKQREFIHFSSGETLEVEETEVGDSTDGDVFREPAEKRRLSWKNVAILVGKMSLQTCDYFGEKLAGVLGLTAAKYQYAIDQYHHHYKETGSQDQYNPTGETLSMSEGVGERIQLSPRHDREYGATVSAESTGLALKKHMAHGKGAHNRGYQEEDEDLRNMENINDL